MRPRPGAAQSRTEEQSPPPLDAIRLVETSRGTIGIEFGLVRAVHPWGDERWVSPDDTVQFEATRAALADALRKVGLPAAEAAAHAATVFDEWQARRGWPSASGRRARRPPAVLLEVNLLVALWILGAAHLALRAWRALR